MKRLKGFTFQLSGIKTNNKTLNVPLSYNCPRNYDSVPDLMDVQDPTDHDCSLYTNTMEGICVITWTPSVTALL